MRCVQYTTLEALEFHCQINLMTKSLLIRKSKFIQAGGGGREGQDKLLPPEHLFFFQAGTSMKPYNGHIVM